ncbi:MAG: response regulator [Acholeplasmataceae bacterium]|nr:response regulator [Acholeplasmataceae bacterium]
MSKLIDGLHKNVEFYQNEIEKLNKMVDELERSNRARLTFFMNISHEIRTVMNIIIGYLHLLSESQMNQEQNDQLKRLTIASNHLIQLMNDILDLSKIESDKFFIDTIPFNLATLIQDLDLLFRETVNQKKLSFEIESEIEIDHLIGDPLRLRQVIFNLISNAIKFTEKGTIKLCITQNVNTSQTVLCHVEVLDTGIGLTDEQQQNLFKPYEQAEKTTQIHYGGTGLGLSISKKIIELMGGEIAVASTKNQGSRFYFDVEFKIANQEPVKTPQSHQKNAMTKVLLVEDNDMTQKITKQILEKHAFEVDVAQSGHQAIEKVLKQRYGLILMDIEMPEINGIDTTIAIRKLENGKDLPILAMTANTFFEQRVKCTRAGMNDHISKPVDPNKLHLLLKQWTK